MCKASSSARKTREAQKGDRTCLGHTPHGFPRFMRPEDVSSETVTCPKTGQQMRISNIPFSAQQEHRISETITATFVEDIGDADDKLFLEDGRLIDFFFLIWGQSKPGETEMIEMLDMLCASERQRILDAIAGRSRRERTYIEGRSVPSLRADT